MSSWQDGVRAALERSVAAGELAGALAILWHKGRIVLSETAGYRNTAQGDAMGRGTIFQIASMTKPIVSVAALQLVEEGKLRLDDPIARWLPEFAAPRVLDDPAGPLESSHPASRPITIDDLLTHRAGFGYAFASSGPIAGALENALGNVLHTRLRPDEWLASLARLPLLCEPGSCFLYGHSTEVLGCLIARIDGCSLGDSIERRVLGPLGLGDTAFHVPADKRARLAHMYRRGVAGFEDVTEAPASPPPFEAGGGGLYSTPDDYLVFGRMLMGGGEVDGVRVLSAPMCRLMMRNQLSDPQRASGGLGRPDFFTHSGFGYGVHIVMEPAPPLFAGIGTVSWGGIFGTGWVADPANSPISLFFAQDFADTSSGPDRRDPAEATPAARLQSEIEQLAWRALANSQGLTDGWVRLARRHRAGGRPRAGNRFDQST